MNIFNAPINMMKSFGFNVPAAQRTVDGYPNGFLASDVGSQGGAPDIPYFDKTVMKWDGSASIGSPGLCAIIYSKTSGVTIPGLTNSCVNSNLTMQSTNTTGHRVVMKHGTLITGVSGGSGSNVVLACVNQPSNIVVGGTVKVGVGVSANLANGPGVGGSWTVAAIGGNTITLANSSGVVSPTVTGSGGPDVQSEVVTAVPGVTWTFSNGWTFANFANLVWVKLANEAAEAAGKLVDPDYVAQLKALGVKWLRTMDSTGVQGNWETAWAARRPKSYLSWSAGVINPKYYVGTITSDGSDNYSAPAPQLTSTGAYKHGEIVIGTPSASNSTGFPKLQVNGRGFKPIIDDSSYYKLKFTAPAASAGQVLSIAFSSSWFTYTFNYTTRDSMTVTGAANNGSGKVRLTVNSTTGYVTGQTIYVSGVVGTTEANNGGQPQTVTVVDATHVDLNINFVNAYVSGGTVTPQYGSDLSSASALQANMQSRFNSDATLSGKVTARNSGSFALYPLTPQKGALTISYSGAVACTTWATPILDGSNNPRMSGTKTFIYCYILDAWIMRDGGQVMSVPFEYYLELANTLNVNIWHNWPMMTTSDMVTNVTAFFRDGLNPGLCFGNEMGNELWNFQQEPWGYAIALGYALGMGNAQHYDNGASYSYNALRARQFGDLAASVWTTTRARRDLYILVMSATFDIASTETYYLLCPWLNSSDALTYGGMDGTAGSTNPATDYSVVGQRVCDNFDGFGIAPYWGSDFLAGDLGSRSGSFSGTVAANAPLLGAALKYKNADFTGCYNDLFNQFYASSSLGGSAGGLNLLRVYKNSYAQTMEAILRKYDSARMAAQGRPIAIMHYEGGPQFGVSPNLDNGTNDATLSIPDIAAKLVSNGWDLSAYSSAGSVAISSGTYNNSTGVITLTLASNVTIPYAAAISSLTGAGAQLSSLVYGWKLSAPVTASNTLTLVGPPGKGTDITITGGAISLAAVEVATAINGMVFNFKFSQQYYQLYYNYMRDLTTVHSGREALGAQYGYSSGQWGLFPISWTRGISTAYSSFQAIADFNSGG